MEIMVNVLFCGFLEKGEKDYRKGTGTRREASGIEW